MWHVETDTFAMAVFIIMLLKEYLHRREKRDVQGNAFILFSFSALLMM